MSDLIIQIDEAKLLDKFTDRAEVESLILSVREVVDGFEHDLTTDAGRKRTASLAAKVSRVKTRADAIGKQLVSGWKKQAKEVDVNRKLLRDSLDDLRDEARLPLDDWEAEQVRIATEKLKAQKAEELRKEIETAHEFGLLLNDKFDAEKAEQERLEKEQAAARKAEQERLEKEREDKIRKEEAERQKAEAERKIREAQEEAERKIKAAARKAEQERQEQERAAEMAAAEIKRRQENEDHRRLVRSEAIAALDALVNDAMLASSIFEAIVEDKIPRVTVNY